MITLNREQRYAAVMTMADELLSRGSWCGETHIQKAIYIYSNIFDDDLSYEFILYKHGPFSFDLRSDLAVMRASNLIELTNRDTRYGPTILTTEFGEKIRERNKQAVSGLTDKIEFVANWIAKSDVKSLERVATALFVSRELPGESEMLRASRLHEYKPHITIDDSQRAIQEVDEKLREAQDQHVM